MEITLQQMMDAREKRAAIQQSLLERHQIPLICFTLNIPGPVKILPGLREVFFNGISNIETILRAGGHTIFETIIQEEPTGYEAFFSVEGLPGDLKLLMTSIEDGDSLGRIYDIDVLCEGVPPISRKDLGLPQRSCLLCDLPAHQCSRNRTHSVEELVSHIQRLIQQ